MSLKAPGHREFGPALCLGIARALQEEIRIATEVVDRRERYRIDAILECGVLRSLRFELQRSLIRDTVLHQTLVSVRLGPYEGVVDTFV